MGQIRGCTGYPQGRWPPKTQITAEQYLQTTFEHDAEFVHGEIVERSMPTYTRSMMQAQILLRFGAPIRTQHLYALPELGVKVGKDVYRIPDVSVYASKPQQEVPDDPPLVAIEILSNDYRHSELMQKLEEYRVWGVDEYLDCRPGRKKVLHLHRARSRERVVAHARRLLVPAHARGSVQRIVSHAR